MAARRLARGIAVALGIALVASGCFLKRDPDMANAEEATLLELGTPKMDQLDCDDGKGDCNDWYRIRVQKPGTLEVGIATVAGQGVGSALAVTLADPKQLSLAEATSGGRSRFGVRSKVAPGDYYVWIHADGSTKGKLGYQVTAELAQGGGTDLGTDVDPSKPRLCLRVEASRKLNFFDGQPHVVRLLIYPLESSLGFEQADVGNLLGGDAAPGAAGAPIAFKIVPGETRTLSDPLPANAHAIGIVADYYRAAGAPGGLRKITLSSSCSGGDSTLRLDDTQIGTP